MIKPIMTYGSEIWISDYKLKFESFDKSPFEKVQNMIFKNLLGVHGKSSNLAVRCELGTLPVVLSCYKLMFKYFLRLNSLTDGAHGILRAAFGEDKLLSKKDNSWSNKMDEILKMFGISSFNISTMSFNKILEEYYINKVKSEMKRIKEGNSGKLLFYSKTFVEFVHQKYLNFEIPKSLRCYLTRIKISAHPLAIETGRYSKPKVPSNQRFCNFCKTKVEDEVHFLFQCPQYNSLRNKYNIISLDTTNFDVISRIINPESFSELKQLCSFIKEALQIRNHLSVD